jgi:phage terminase large subunit-like protein
MTKAGKSKNLPENVVSAIQCGAPFNYRDWRSLPTSEMTRAEKAMAFVERYHPIPDGEKVGQLVELLPFQEALFYQAIDTDCWQLVVSMARKNAKTETIARIINAYLLGSLAEQNSSIAVAANSRDQAAHLFNYLTKSLQLSRELDGLYRIIPSQKKIIGLRKNVTFQCLSAEAKNAHGGQYKLIVVDELGQHVGASYPFYDALVTGQGTQKEPKMLILSTQAASDGDLLSNLMDAAIREGSTKTAVHLYAADKDCEVDDENQWQKANPALGYFRSRDDIERQCADAKAIPSAENRFRLLILNQRTPLDSLWLAPAAWKACGDRPDLSIFQDGRPVAMGLDLSQKTDLTAACLSAKDDDGAIHFIPFAFTPSDGIAERELKSKAPFREWVRTGQLIAVPGKTIDYEWMFGWLRSKLDDMQINVDVVAFDRWRIFQAKADAERAGFIVPSWQEVGQGFASISPRIEFFETLLLQGKIKHGSHPLLNLGAAAAICVADAASNKKLDKSKSTQKIDVLMAALMSAGVFMVEPEGQFSVDAFA